MNCSTIVIISIHQKGTQKNTETFLGDRDPNYFGLLKQKRGSRRTRSLILAAIKIQSNFPMIKRSKPKCYFHFPQIVSSNMRAWNNCLITIMEAGGLKIFVRGFVLSKYVACGGSGVWWKVSVSSAGPGEALCMLSRK